MTEEQTPHQPSVTPVPRRGRGRKYPLWLLPEQEEALIDRADRAAAKSPSAYIKHRVFDTPLPVRVKRIVHAADPAFLRQLAKIGNNINQIARILNMSGEVKPEDAAPLLLSLAIIAETLDALSEQATAS